MIKFKSQEELIIKNKVLVKVLDFDTDIPDDIMYPIQEFIQGCYGNKYPIDIDDVLYIIDSVETMGEEELHYQFGLVVSKVVL